jgi:hypothetical protein
MVRAALDQHVACVHLHHLSAIEIHLDGPRHADNVVDRVGAMHEMLVAGLDLEYGEARAARRRGNAHLARRRIVHTVEGGGNLIAGP